MMSSYSGNLTLLKQQIAFIGVVNFKVDFQKWHSFLNTEEAPFNIKQKKNEDIPFVLFFYFILKISAVRTNRVSQTFIDQFTCLF